MARVSSFLEESAARRPDKEAIVFRDERVTYGGLDERANCLRNALLEFGLQPGERVATHLDSPLETVVTVFAALKAGAIFTVLSPLLTPASLKSILNNCQPAVVVADSPSGARIADDAEGVRFVVTAGPAQGLDREDSVKPRHAMHNLLRLPPPPRYNPASHRDEDDPCGLFYTSGSTGRPKGVAVSHRNVVAASTSILEYLDITSSDVVLNLLPLSSDYGLYNVLMPILCGCLTVLDRPFVHPGQLVRALNSEGVTGLPITPTITAILRRFRDLGIRNPEQVRWITSTGQTLPPTYSQWLKSTFPAAKIYSMYGVTECKRVSYLPPEELESRPTSVGKAIPNTEVRLVDAVGLPITRAGDVGELVVSGPHVMLGYWNEPSVTAEILGTDDTGETYLRTGDLFTTDEEGYLYFVGRRDRMIKSGGHRVSPNAVEDAAHRIDGINEAAAFAVAHDVLGSAFRLVVVVDRGFGLTVENIRDFLTQQLESYLVPKEIVIRRSIPKTAAGKVDYSALALETDPDPIDDSVLLS